MKRTANLTGVMAMCFRQYVCPFCKEFGVENPAMPWCSNPKCTVEYVIGRGRARTIVFDDQRSTPRFALGRALNRAGGVRIGK